MKNKIKLNLSGLENRKMLPRKNMLISINHSLMIGRNIWLSNNSLLKDNLNSKLFSSFPRELPSICLRPKRKRITSNFMLEEFSLWTIVKNWSLNGWTLLKVLSTLRIFLLISPENSYNTTKSLRLSRKISSKNPSKWSWKSLKMLKISRNSTNNSPKILNLVSMKTLLTELNSLNFSDITPLNLVKNKPLLKIMLPEWKKPKKISTLLLVNPELP